MYRYVLQESPSPTRFLKSLPWEKDQLIILQIAVIEDLQGWKRKSMATSVKLPQPTLQTKVFVFCWLVDIPIANLPQVASSRPCLRLTNTWSNTADSICIINFNRLWKHGEASILYHENARNMNTSQQHATSSWISPTISHRLAMFSPFFRAQRRCSPKRAHLSKVVHLWGQVTREEAWRKMARSSRGFWKTKVEFQ